MGRKTPSLHALANILWCTSIVMMKSIGDNKSPWRTPLKCLIGGPRLPLSMILDDVVESNAEIHLHQFWLKPLACKSSNEKG